LHTRKPLAAAGGEQQTALAMSSCGLEGKIVHPWVGFDFTKVQILILKSQWY